VAVENQLDSDRYSNTIGSLSVLSTDNSRPIPKYRRLGGANFNRQPNAFGFEEQYRESKFDIARESPIYSAVKWFNPKRGFGFVELSDGSGDAFLHRNALAKRGMDAVQPGALLNVHVVQGDRGPQVVQVLSVDTSTAVPVTQRRRKTRSSGPSEEAGTVKSFNLNKGFGFIVRDEGGNDVFVHVSDLTRSKVPGLSEGQRVIVDVTEGRKGPKARRVRLADR
jgi:CspA family cold shock protein